MTTEPNYNRFILEQEDDGRWLACVEGGRGLMAYGTTSDEAIANVKKIVASILEAAKKEN